MNQQPRVHGLDGNLVQPDWPFLTLDETDRLLRLFPAVQKAERILSFSPRPFSAASVVVSPHGKVFVKRHHSTVRSKADLLEEHHLLQYLHQRDPIVIAPLRDVKGESVASIGEWTYEVFPLPGGIDLYEDAQSWTPFLSGDHARNAGRALAQLHAAAAGYAAPARRTRTLLTSFTIFAKENPWPELRRYVDVRPHLHAYVARYDWSGEIEDVFSEFHSRLCPFLSTFRPLWTHNDFHASNLFWSSASAQAEVTSIIDFGLADRTNAVHDVATAIERNSIRWLEIAVSTDVVDFANLDAFLAGYESVRTLSRMEAQAVAALLPLVHAEFALSETDYFLRVLNSTQKADVAYKTYLLGHARWFTTEPGKRLLEHLSRWADLHEERPAPTSPSVTASIPSEIQE